MKYLLLFLVAFGIIPALGQSILEEEYVELVFRETHYNVPVTRQFCDTTITHIRLEVDEDNEIQISRFADLYPRAGFDSEYYPFRFSRSRDSLFIDYEDPSTKEIKKEYVFPINYRDTVENFGRYLGFKQPVRKTIGDSTYVKEVVNWGNSGSYDAIYKGDTVVLFDEYVFNCYVIEQEGSFNRNGWKKKKRVCIEKSRLVPLYQEEKLYKKRHGWTNCAELNQWKLYRRMQLIGIDAY